MLASSREFFTHRRLNLIELFAYDLAALVGSQPAHGICCFPVAQIRECADHQLGGHALPKVRAATNLKWNPHVLQGALKEKADRVLAVQHRDALRGLASTDQLADGARH